MKIRARLSALFLLVTVAASVGEERVVTIESARMTQYIKRAEAKSTSEPVGADEAGEADVADAEGETRLEAGEGYSPQEDDQVGAEQLKRQSYGAEMILFSGEVVIVVTEGASKSTISADEIVYDKGRDTLEARGNVTYEHSTGKSGSERFVGEALLFDIKKEEGVFLKGIVTQDSGKKDSDPYIIHSEVTGRDSSTTMAFKNGVLTTCDEEEPHWSINASRIWLLPGNEIAILNGLFFIGPLPVFYIPFFYYPGDEMIFHPVFGYRNREGYFVQTTTYLMGRKPLPVKDKKSGNSFSDFLQGDVLKEQKREGLFFRNQKEDAKDIDPDYLKLMVDGYSSLGAMVGLDGSFSTDSYFKTISFLVSAGFSRTLYEPSSGLSYSTYDDEGKEHYNSGVFFGYEVPFRYRTKLSVQMDKKPFTLSMSMPLVSDPEYQDDFLDRSEDLNWFKLLTDKEELAKDENDSDETSYSWNINGSINPDMSATSPWLKTLSVSNISGVMTFNSKTNNTLTGQELLYSPERKFYYPEIIKPEIKLSIAGTVLTSSRGGTEKKQTEGIATGGLANPFSTLPEQMPSASDAEIDPDAGTGSDEETPKDESGEAGSDPGTSPPANEFKAGMDRFIPAPGNVTKAVTGRKGSEYSITWGLDPSFAHETRYDSSEWNESRDIDWNEYSSLYYQLKSSARLKGDYSWDTDFFSVTAALNFTGTYQEHPWLSDDVYDTEVKKNKVYLSDYEESVYSLTNSDTVKYVPFNRSEFLKPISLSWNFAGDIVKTEFTGTADEPEWETKTFEWDEDYIDTHTAASTLGVAIGPYEQKLTLTSNLPPLLESYGGNMGFSWFFGSLTMTSKLYEKEDAAENREWLWDPFKAVLSWKFPYNIALGQEYTYDIEDEKSTRLSFTGSYKSLSAYYTLTDTVPYDFEEGEGWVLRDTGQEFVPTAAGMAFNNGSNPLNVYQWDNRVALQLKVVSNLEFNLLKLTDSSFTFSPSLTLKIFEFLDLTFSSTSSNEVIARYFQDWMDLPTPLPGETNIFKDLYKSVNFFDEQGRKESGFKLKSLNFELTHYLHDWTMNFKTSIKPELEEDGGRYSYEFVPTVTFVVQWKPISDIKTTVKSDEGVFSLNTTDDEDDDDDDD